MFLKTLGAIRGRSLVEILVVTVFFIVFFLMAHTLLKQGQDFGLILQARVELRQQAQVAALKMSRDLRLASEDSILSVPADGTWYTSIRFLIPSGVTNNTLQWPATEMLYYRGGTGSADLIRQYGTDTSIEARKITALSFRRQAASPEILEVSMIFGESTVRVNIQESIAFNLQLRNSL